MDILRFVSWWWNKKNFYEKFTFSIITWTVLLIPNLIIFGLKGFVIYFGMLLLAGAFFAAREIYRSINKQWRLFRAERDREAQQIVDVLSGNPPMFDRSDILANIRRRIRKP